MISIIIPTYNHAKELKACLLSIVRQSYKDFEVIVVDDGSEDNPGAEANRFQVSSFKFQVQFLHQDHKGAPAARNLGFRKSRGEYLLFCDADVQMEPTMLQSMLEALTNPKFEARNPKQIQNPKSQIPNKSQLPITNYQLQNKYAFVYSSFRLGFKTFHFFPFDLERLRRMPYIHTTSLIRRECFPGFDESLKKFQDWDLFLTMGEQGHTGVWIPKVLYSITPRRSGMSIWLPPFAYHIPWKKFGIRIGAIERYNEAMRIIREKHKLTL